MTCPHCKSTDIVRYSNCDECNACGATFNTIDLVRPELARLSTLKPEGEQISGDTVESLRAELDEVHRYIAEHRLYSSEQISGEAVERGWRPIETAPKDGSWVMLYWPTMSFNMYPAVGFHHGDDYGWELSQDRDYGEIIPTHWMTLPTSPERKT